MKKHFYLLLTSLWLTISTAAQNVGVGTSTPKAAFNVAKGKTVLFGRDTIGDGGRFMWMPSKYATRIGAIGYVEEWDDYYFGDTTAWNYDSIGMFSFVAGFQNTATQVGSVAFGALNNSRGPYSTALGWSNTTSGSNSLSSGAYNQTLGEFSTALGHYNLASGDYSLAFGEQNESIGDHSIALGYYSRSIGDKSIAIGFNNNSFANNGVSIGYWNYNYANAGHVLGVNLINNSYCSMVIGINNAPIVTADSAAWVLTDPLFMIGNGQYSHERNNALVMLKNGKTGFGTNTPEALIHGLFDSSPGIPQLMLEESTTDYARITMKNSNPSYWDIAGYCQPFLSSNENAKLNFYFGSFGNVLSLKGNGNAILSGTLTQNSDIRLKKNIEPLSDALSRVLKINSYTYNWKDTIRGIDQQIGFIAQELEQQFPELVETDEEGMKSVAYSNMVPVLLEAIKEQQRQIDELKALLKDR
jgi:hypothetical protein